MTVIKFKDGMSLEQAADRILRDYLLRCYRTVSKQYPPIADMTPEVGVDYLFKMRDTGKITLSLYPEGDLVKCRIDPVN